jgi:hypothetical protein
MTVFDVFLNGRKLHRAGVGNDGVLNAIVSWVKLTGPAAQAARRSKHPLEEMRLHVGGLARGTHRSWADQKLEAGDRVTIAVEASRSFDPPVRTKPRDPQLEERQQKRYYLHLKEKFEGRAKPSSVRDRVVEYGATRFLNVDLDIWSASPLDPIVRAFGRKVVVLHAGKEGRGRYGAHLELTRSGRSEDADRLIRGFVRLIKKLPPRARASWNRARRRDFNLGIQAASRPYSYELPVRPETLDGVASVNARLVVTVYAPANR